MRPPLLDAPGGLKVGLALYTGWVALVVTAIVGGLGLVFGQPWLLPSLGPTILMAVVTPDDPAARPWNTFAGHAVGAGAGLLALAACGALHAPLALAAGHVTPGRIVASALAVAVTIGAQIPLRAVHAPAAATALLITLGVLPADLATLGTVVAGVGLATVLCDGGRRLIGRELRLLGRVPAGPSALAPAPPRGDGGAAAPAKGARPMPPRKPKAPRPGT